MRRAVVAEEQEGGPAAGLDERQDAVAEEAAGAMNLRPYQLDAIELMRDQYRARRRADPRRARRAEARR